MLAISMNSVKDWQVDMLSTSLLFPLLQHIKTFK